MTGSIFGQPGSRIFGSWEPLAIFGLAMAAMLSPELAWPAEPGIAPVAIADPISMTLAGEAGSWRIGGTVLLCALIAGIAAGRARLGIDRSAVGAAMVVCWAVMIPSPGWSRTLGEIASQAAADLGRTTVLIDIVAYVMAGLFVLAGLVGLIRSIKYPQQSGWGPPITMIMVGGLIALLPQGIAWVQDTFGGSTGTSPTRPTL